MIQVQRRLGRRAALAPLGFTPLGDGDAHAQLASVAAALRSRAPAAPDVPTAELDESPGPRRGVPGRRGGHRARRAALDGDWLLVCTALGRRARRTGVRAWRPACSPSCSTGAPRWARRTALLHVETDNPGAIALYERHGFVTHHTNRYLRLAVRPVASTVDALHLPDDAGPDTLPTTRSEQPRVRASDVTDERPA